MAHHRFEVIHPFLGRNGRAGRLVLSLLLGRLGYPPAISYKHDRSAQQPELGRGVRADAMGGETAPEGRRGG
ncbi:Fic family protein [Micromonospora deserti]|uniref:Fic family protein n=1 Tax=Micromonospora deserti TaxID=2070366 RepID=UPI001F37E9E5|nr:Fic family protein [Micromonospora deserti]